MSNSSTDTNHYDFSKVIDLPQENSEKPVQLKPFLDFPNGPCKRIDYVLVYHDIPDSSSNLAVLTFTEDRLENSAISSPNNQPPSTPNKNSTSSSLRKIITTVQETREIFLKNLIEKGFEAYRIKSDGLEPIKGSEKQGQVTFILLHLPFEKLEEYATKLQINKPINDAYVKLIDRVTKKTISNTSVNATLSEQDIDEIKREFEKEEAKNIEFEDTRGNENGNKEDVIDQLEQAGAKEKITQWVRRTFTVENEYLKDEDPFFTCVYDKEKAHIFHNYYYEDDNGNRLSGNPEMFTPAERSKIASYMLMECAYIEGATEASTNFSIERLLITKPPVFVQSYPLHDCGIKTVLE